MILATILLSHLLLSPATPSAADCPMHAEHAAAASTTEGHTCCMHADADGKASSMADCPLHARHTSASADPQHGAGVDHRHDTLGMSHEATKHSFQLFADGGAIELRANALRDAPTIDAIRTHLRQIASSFQNGDFSTPAFVHDHPPDGVAAMAQLRDRIRYQYEELPAGARVRITTNDAEALRAVHQFLRFQVIEHRTGNSGEIESDD